MARVITYSRHFPSYHPKAGQPTFFVEKIWKAIWDASKGSNNPLTDYWQEYNEAFPLKFDTRENIHTNKPKIHTIRAGKRWKAGDVFSPRVWSGKPYNSKQIILADDIVIPRVADFEIHHDGIIYIDNRVCNTGESLSALAENDGLTIEEMRGWFNKTPFSGQIIFHIDIKTPY